MNSIKYGDKLKTKEELFGNVFFPPGSSQTGVKVEPEVPKGTIFKVTGFEIRVSDSNPGGVLTYFTISSFDENNELDHMYSFTTNYYKEYADHFHSLFE